MVATPHFPSHVLTQPFLPHYPLHRSHPQLGFIHFHLPLMLLPPRRSVIMMQIPRLLAWAVWGQLPLSHRGFQTWETLELHGEPLRMNVPEASLVQTQWIQILGNSPAGAPRNLQTWLSGDWLRCSVGFGSPSRSSAFPELMLVAAWLDFPWSHSQVRLHLNEAGRQQGCSLLFLLPFCRDHLLWAGCVVVPLWGFQGTYLRTPNSSHLSPARSFSKHAWFKLYYLVHMYFLSLRKLVSHVFTKTHASI